MCKGRSFWSFWGEARPTTQINEYPSTSQHIGRVKHNLLDNPRGHAPFSPSLSTLNLPRLGRHADWGTMSKSRPPSMKFLLDFGPHGLITYSFPWSQNLIIKALSLQMDIAFQEKDDQKTFGTWGSDAKLCLFVFK